MGVYARAMSWYTSPPGSPAPGSAAEAQHALSSSPRGGDASFDTNMVIVLAALLFALLFALGINSLARCLIRWRARRAPAGEGAGAGTGTGGLEKRVLRSMPVEVYGAAAVAADAEVCAICLGEFADGEKVRVLPRCAHGFHVRCVDTWLLSHDSCPTCRRSVLDGATKAASSAAPVGGGGRRQGSEAAAIAVVIG